MIDQLIEITPFGFTTLLFILGTCIGSFLNVCIFRMPQEGHSIIRPGSYCPSCKKSIKWYDNIPIVGYCLLQGKCRHCEAPISPQYMIVEIITGFLFVQYFIIFGFTIEYLFYLYLTCSLLVATAVDFKWQIIPDEVNFAGMVVGVVLSCCFPVLQGTEKHLFGLGYSLIGLLVGGGIIYLTGTIGDFVFKKESMGGGDVKLMAMIGAFLGWKMVVLTFFLAPFFGSVVGLYVKYVKKEEIIPYGPFLSLAALVTVFAGEAIIQFIFR